MALISPGQKAFQDTGNIGNFGTPSTNLVKSPFQGVNSSTAQTSGNLMPGENLLKQAWAGHIFEGPQPVKLQPTNSGGVSFDPAHAPVAMKPTTQVSAPNPTPSAAQSLGQYTINSNPTPGGGTLTTNGQGTPTGYASNGFSIDTGNVPSSALISNVGYGDIAQKHAQYSDYVNALSQAQGYSPDYLQALQSQYGAQTQGAALGYRAADINANLATGKGLAGYTTDQAQTITGQQQQMNSLGLAQNSIQQLAANQALNTQQLARTGNIAAAQSQLQYSPEGKAGANAIEQYNSLQQAYPGASIPEYNQALTPEQNQQVASFIVANSPAYRSQFQSTYQQAGGGTGIYNKLDTGGLSQNSDGTLSLVSDAASALGKGQAQSVQNNIDIYNKLAPAYKAANDDFTYITNFMKSAGVNQSNVPVVNQIQNAINAKALNPGATAAFKSAIQSLRSNYANLLSARTGSVVGVNEEANALIPENLTITQLQQVQAALNANGQNVLDATKGQIQQSLSGLSGNSSFSGNSQNQAIGTSWDNL